MDPSLCWDDDLKGLRLKLVVPAKAATHRYVPPARDYMTASATADPGLRRHDD